MDGPQSNSSSLLAGLCPSACAAQTLLIVVYPTHYCFSSSSFFLSPPFLLCATVIVTVDLILVIVRHRAVERCFNSSYRASCLSLHNIILYRINIEERGEGEVER